MSLVGNERIKLSAGLLNTVAAAFLVTGGVAPLVAISYQLPGPSGGWLGLAFTIIWILVGIGIHLMARRLLKGTEAMTGAEVYAWYIAPLVVLAACYGLYRWADRHTGE